MKSGIHPVYETRKFHCYGCGTEWNTRTTLKPAASDGMVHLDICSNCHPFFTGKQKLLDTQGRIDRFNKKYAKTPAKEKAPRAEKAETAPAREKAPKKDKAPKAAEKS